MQRNRLFSLLIIWSMVIFFSACSSHDDFKPRYASYDELNPVVQGVPAVSSVAPQGPFRSENSEELSSRNLSDPSAVQPAKAPQVPQEQQVKVKRVYVPYYPDYYYRPWFRPFMGWHWGRPWRYGHRSHFGFGLGFGF